MTPVFQSHLCSTVEYPSQTLAQAVEALSSLPGIGRKTALRLALHLTKADPHTVEQLAQALLGVARNTRRCTRCYNLTDTDLCTICASPKRDARTVCVVADIQDVLALERTGQYNGLYHVLGGLISPLDGISPTELSIPLLESRLQHHPDTEVILALAASMEGETTAFYLARRLQPFGVRLTSIARGVPVGSELEYTDELTLARSLQTRTTYALPPT
jgi:recombination protein RecR